MNRPAPNPKIVWATVALASLLWFVTFFLSWSNFWIKISFSALTLALLAIILTLIVKPSGLFGQQKELEERV